MSMILDLYAVPDEAIDALVENPEFIKDYLGGRVSDPEPPPPPGFLARLMGRKPEPWEPKPVPEVLRRRRFPEESLEKTWHGLHFLLTGKAGAEDEFGEEQDEAVSDDPAYWLIYGGVIIDEDVGYGPPHAFKSSEVKRYLAYLESVDEEALLAAYDPQKMEAMGLYAGDWVRNSEQELNWLVEYFQILREFVSKTASDNHGLVIALY
ncbi:MAG: YfbM family protein [Candidatus Sumerlaeia bacterium]|nr:YfbM family protein [Candidatus Sumerlaeia bacterium]